MRTWAIGGLLLLLLLGPRPLVGQEALDEVESLMARGMIFQARDRLADWWDRDRSRAGRPALQRGIWLRGKLTVDPSLAALDYRRLTLEFPGGPFSDDAHLRLAQEAQLVGDLPEALNHFRALQRDYPGSPLRSLADAWLRENQQTAEEAQAREAHETRADPAPPREPGRNAQETAQRGSISLQLGAFRNLDGARSLVADLATAGYEARLARVPGSDLIRVRVGFFRTREEARDLRQELQGRGWDSTVVTNAHEEEGVG